MIALRQLIGTDEIDCAKRIDHNTIIAMNVIKKVNRNKILRTSFIQDDFGITFFVHSISGRRVDFSVFDKYIKEMQEIIDAQIPTEEKINELEIMM